MAGLRGRGSELRIKDSTGTYKKVPGCQDINLNYPTVGTIDASDQDTPTGALELLPGDASEGSLETQFNFNVDEPQHVQLYNALRNGTPIDIQVKIAGPGGKRHSANGAVVRSMPIVLSKDGLQRASLSLGVGDFGSFEVDA